MFYCDYLSFISEEQRETRSFIRTAMESPLSVESNDSVRLTYYRRRTESNF